MDTHVAYVADQDSNSLSGSVRAVEPPADTRQSRRGNLYVVVDLSGDQAIDDLRQFAEHLISMIQRTYYTAKGGQSQVLIQATQMAYRRILDFNNENPTTALKFGVISACLLKNRLIIVTDRASVALIGEERIEVFPEDIVNLSLAHDEDEISDLEIYRRELTTDGAFFLGTARWLKQVTLRDLAETVAYASGDNCQAIATALSSHSREPKAMGMLVAFEPSTGVQKEPAVQQRRAYRDDGLENLTPAASIDDLPTSVQMAQTGLQRSPAQEVSHAEIIPGMPQHVPEPAAPMPRPDLETIIESHVEVEWDEVQNGMDEPVINQVRDPQPLTDTQILIQNIQGWFEKARARVKGWRLPHWSGARVRTDDGNSGLSLPSFTPPEPARGSRARFYTLLAVLILTLVPLITYILVQQQGAPATEEAEALLSRASESLQNARSVYDEGNGDKVEARTLLTEAESLLAGSEEITGRTDQSVKLAAEVQRELQSVLQITPLYQLVEPLVSFPNNALPERMVVINQDIYILDTGRNIVSYFRTDITGEFIADTEGVVVLRQGDVIDNVAVGRLADIGWQSLVPGVEDKANLLVLDRNNNIFRYNQTDGVSRIDFGPQNSLQISNRLAIYDGRIYIGDEGRSQLYRYDPGRYDQPIEWFSPQSGINLVGLLSIQIDGDIWLLFNNGQLLRYFQGQQKPFTLDSSIGLSKEPVDMYIGRQENSLIYIADASNERIMVFEKDGTYLRQLKAAEGNPLRGLLGVYADEVAGNLYILTQSALFQHPIPR